MFERQTGTAEARPGRTVVRWTRGDTIKLRDDGVVMATC